ncbi:DEAD/DEAH box helicase [Natronomonas sp.]|uniref:DEAD/DEAH box helicase n=1 Tax=Natronomonas sp. TaxID=2184060 RepID=UPI002639D60E|nr:DEAD/DEAH box helicase [Natronomonas sp.]
MDDTRPPDGRTLVERFPRRGLTTDSGRVSTVTVPPREAATVPADGTLPPALAEPYPHELYTHQAAALSALSEGKNVCVSTSTASGKTHVYALRIARHLLESGVIAPDGSRTGDPSAGSTALCVYPMKALTKDQHEALEALYDALGLDVRVRVYDGDTPRASRREIRESADVVLTNFQALHVYLEHHDRWSRFYSAVDLIAIDESHTYTGVQGMHVAWILRRLRRVIEYWGGDPEYVLTSATIGNPAAHSAELLGEPVTVVDDDGSPRGPRDVVLWNPPPTEGPTDESVPDEPTTDPESASDSEEGVTDRVPASVEAPRVFGHLTARDVETLLFCPSRKLTELSVRRAAEHVRSEPHAYDAGTPPLEPYHAGLGKRTRHAREQAFKTGDVTGLATTSALELGIDIGSLEAAVLMGYPGQRQSFRQRIGRAGRGTERSLAVMIADHRTLDQYVVSNPEYLLETSVEDAVVDVSNDAVFARHLLCAADEIAIGTDDLDAFADADRLERAIEMWRRAGRLEGHPESAVHYVGPRRPQSRISVYGTDETEFRLELSDGVDRARWGLPEDVDLEPVGRNRAYRDYHEGAVRLHDGQQFEVVSVDETRRRPTIELAPVDVDYYTRTRSDVTVMDAESERHRTINGFELHFGRGTVLVHHHAYDRVSIDDSDPEEAAIPTGTPPISMDTQLCWVEVPEGIESALVRKYREYGVETGVDPDDPQPPHLGYVAGLHAAEHATIQTAPLELRVDKGDLGGLATLALDTHYAHRELEPLSETTDDSLAAAEHALRRRGRELDTTPSSGWFVYDGVEGGLGFARAIYDSFEALAERARDQLRDCECGRPNGCPACTFDENCGNDNRPLLRAAAIDTLDALLGERTPGSFDPERSASDSDSDSDSDSGDDRRPVVFYS